ncbi:hypothetical protein GW17_00061086 [Ensete ventricosum]|nr:hypothetical protein GW17_00061086 [Ensete ventricosum]
MTSLFAAPAQVATLRGVAVPTSGSLLRVRRGQPLAGWPLAVGPYGLVADGRPLLAHRWQPPMRAGHSRQPPCRGALAATGRPCRGGGIWPWPVAPLQGALAAAGCPLAANHGQPLLLAVLAANAGREENRRWWL